MLRTLQPGCFYSVIKGDTIAAVAGDFGVSIADLKRANPGEAWIHGAQWIVPGHECVYDSNSSRGAYTARPSLPRLGLSGLNDAVGSGDVPLTNVPAGTKVSVSVQSTISTAPNAQTLANIKATLESFGYTVISIDAGGFFTPQTTVLFSANLNDTLWHLAYSVWTVCVNRGVAGNYSGVTASIASAVGTSIYGTPVGTPGGGSVNPTVGATVPPTPVNPGDAVKVTLAATGDVGGAGNSLGAGRIVNMLAAQYSVIGVDVASVGSFGGTIYITVQATAPTTLAAIAAACNQAASAAGYAVNQLPGGIYASFYTRAAANAPAPTPGIQPGAVNAGPSAAAATGSFFDSIAQTVGLSTGLPLTGAVVAGVLVVGAIILLRR